MSTTTVPFRKSALLKVRNNNSETKPLLLDSTPSPQFIKIQPTTVPTNRINIPLLSISIFLLFLGIAAALIWFFAFRSTSSSSSSPSSPSTQSFSSSAPSTGTGTSSQSLLSSSGPNGGPNTYKVCGDLWAFGTTCPDLTANINDILLFNFGSPHTVNLMASASTAYPTCSFVGATSLATIGPYSYTIPTSAAGTSIYFACNVPTHCASGGMHLKVTVNAISSSSTPVIPPSSSAPPVVPPSSSAAPPSSSLPPIPPSSSAPIIGGTSSSPLPSNTILTLCLNYCNYQQFDLNACAKWSGNPNITLQYLNGCPGNPFPIPSFDTPQFRMQIASNVPLYYTGTPLSGWPGSTNPFNPQVGYYDASLNSNKFLIDAPGEPQPGSNINILPDPYFGFVTSYLSAPFSDNVYLQNSLSTNIALPNPPNIFSVSWSLWIRSATFSSQTNIILSNSGSNSWLTPTLRFSSGTWNVVTLDIIGQSPCSVGTLAALTGGYPIDGGWHLVVWTLNATNNLYNFTIYLDGSVPSSLFTQTLVNATTLNCGAFTPGMELGDVQAKNFEGSYALFTQYNTTLTSNQVYQLYQAQKPSCLSVCYAYGATAQSCQNYGGNFSLGYLNAYGCFLSPLPLSLPVSSTQFQPIGSYPLVSDLNNYITGNTKLSNSSVPTFVSSPRGNVLSLTGAFTLVGDVYLPSSYTVCLWIAIGTFGGGNGAWTVLGGSAFNLGFQGGGTPASIVQGRGYSSTFNSQTVASAIIPTTGTWQHICYTFNALSGQATIYYNALNVAQNIITSTLWGPSSSTWFYLFGLPNYSYDLTGSAQCLRIWDVELDAASITSENSRTSSTCPLA